MKKQRLTIEVHDHRKPEADPQVETFTSHGPYLRRMKELAQENAHMAEATKSVVHLLPKQKADLFQGAKGEKMERRLEKVAQGLDP